MLKDNLITPRVFQDNDPWLFSVLNNSLNTMKARDDQLADAIDAGGGLGGFLVDVTGGTPTVIHLPTGWTVTKVSTGVYTLTHNFGVSSYTIFPGVVSTTLACIFVSSVSANYFTISTTSPTGTPVDVRFTCFVTRYA